MGFIRVKKIKRGEYAYYVENKRKKEKVRQKSRLYLGRVLRHNVAKDTGFFEFHSITDSGDYIKNNNKEKIINDLVGWELYKHDIKEELDNIKNNKIVFKINEGYLCNFTLDKLFNFKAEPDERETGIKLAKAFVGAGIKIPEELFVGVFGKVFRL